MQKSEGKRLKKFVCASASETFDYFVEKFAFHIFYANVSQASFIRARERSAFLFLLAVDKRFSITLPSDVLAPVQSIRHNDIKTLNR